MGPKPWFSTLSPNWDFPRYDIEEEEEEEEKEEKEEEEISFPNK